MQKNCSNSGVHTSYVIHKNSGVTKWAGYAYFTVPKVAQNASDYASW